MLFECLACVCFGAIVLAFYQDSFLAFLEQIELPMSV